MVTADNDEEWLSKFTHLRSKNHEIINVKGDGKDWDRPRDTRKHWSLAFIDQKPAERRQVDINALVTREDKTHYVG